MTSILAALGALVGFVVLVGIIWLTARWLGRREFQAKADAISLERARRRHEINAEVDRLSEPELDDELRGRRR